MSNKRRVKVITPYQTITVIIPDGHDRVMTGKVLEGDRFYDICELGFRTVDTGIDPDEVSKFSLIIRSVRRPTL